ncbi:MAG: HAD-IG family 5'-nucleotidase [bacterium]
MPEPTITFPPPAPGRGIYCNRTLNLRSIKAIGYDMDYTLIHYRDDAWEQRAYEHLRRGLVERGWPVGDLTYDPDFIMRGLILDAEMGNVVKANRFGYIKQALHGTCPLTFDELRSTYSRTIVDLSEPRWYFLNTLFSLSEGFMFAQTVDLLDKGALGDAIGYEDLLRIERKTLDRAHTEGALKADILAKPDNYIMHDPESVEALLDQKHAGKKLLLITNSDWEYTREIMAAAFDPHLPKGMAWRNLFDLVIVSARKPSFFSDPNPAFEVVDEEGLLKPVIGKLKPGGIYLGGNASQVEGLWGFAGEEILYVGDHIFSDVRVSKDILRWRTALILRELEGELDALEGFREEQNRLTDLMARKEKLEYQSNLIRLSIQRLKGGYLPAEGEVRKLQQEADRLRGEIVSIDEEIGVLAKISGELMNPHWGLIMRAGNDKSHFTRQVENYADIYMSRVSNFLNLTPFAYLRSPRHVLPHDPLR